MKIAEYSVILNGNLQAAWDKLVDWRTMADWDTLMKSIEFDGPLQVGSTGKLIVQNGQEFAMRVTQLDAMKDYTDEFSVMGMRFVFYHQLTQQSPEQIKMYFSIACEGLFAFVMGPLLGKDLTGKLQVLMTNFKNQFEDANK